ncbi:hypothetical protein ED733_004234 [Metarhizium rileyi]|uniref:DNA/RNA-binding domain-containing protein n=1 Tax=Metarhizium rileyi (strain RCEF 4871) TaxID=1649241 RepID=A0A5C6G5K3_METRR|nr:hypothetical protein ED733_004234 [Metarhizium rileyi]
MDKLTKGWVEHQRRVARQEAATRGSHCPLCQMELEPSVEAFKAHYTSKHPTADELDAIEALNNCALHSNDAVRTSDDDDFPRNRTSTDRQLWTADGGHGNSPQRPRMPQTRYGRGHSGQHRAQSPEPSDATADSADLPLLLFYYAKSLCVPIPFHSTKDSVKTLFEPLLDMEPDATLEGVELVDAAFVRVHAVLFTDTHKDLLEPSMRLFLGLLDKRIGSEHGFFLETGYYIGISLSCLLLGFGDESNVLMKAIPKSQECMADESDDEEPEPSDAFWMAVSFTAQTFNLILTRSPDKNTWSCIHTLLVFYRFMVRFDAGKRYLEDIIPWEKFALLLNYLLRQTNNPRRLDTPVFPWPEDGQAKPLPEDYALRGCVYTEDYFPDKWFDNAGIEEQARCLELPSVAEQRRERLVWLGHGLAMRNERLHWNEDERQFFATESDNNNL